MGSVQVEESSLRTTSLRIVSFGNIFTLRRSDFVCYEAGEPYQVCWKKNILVLYTHSL